MLATKLARAPRLLYLLLAREEEPLTTDPLMKPVQALFAVIDVTDLPWLMVWLACAGILR